MSNSTEMRRLRIDSLRIHPSAQRKLVPATIRKIRRRVNVGAIGTIHVVEYVIDGVRAFWVVDGQHRVVALLAEGYGDLVVDVMVHTDAADDAAAHALFLDLNTRGSVAAFDTFVNERGMGDPVAVGVTDIVRKNGFTIDRASRDGTITCVSALKSLFAKDDGAALSKTLATTSSAWGHTAAAAEGKVVEGVGIVFARYNGQVDRPALVKKLAKYPGGAPGLIGHAKALKASRAGSLGRCVAEIVVETYNKGRRSGQLERI